MIIKIQRDMTGSSVLLSRYIDGHILCELTGDTAIEISRAYNLGPMGKTLCEGEIDDNGLLLLGQELEI